MRNVIDQFLSGLPRHLEGFKEAIERQDTKTLIKTAHACKGSAVTIGAPLMAEISSVLELIEREGKMTDANAKFTQWLQEHNRTIRALQQEQEPFTSSL